MLASAAVAAVFAAAIPLGIGGCASNADNPAAQTPAPGTTTTTSTRWVSTNAEGLDIRWLVIEGGNDVAPTFALLEENFPVPASPESLQLWRDVGLRVAAIPAQHIQLLTERTGWPRAREQRWLPNPSTWHELTRGPAYPGGLILTLDRGRIRMPPGRPRLLVRAWTRPIADPDTGPRSALRLDIVPQHETRPHRSAADGSLTPTPSLTLLDAEAQGMVFRRFTLSIDAEPGMAYVVYAEAPQVDWSLLALGATESAAPSWFQRLPEPREEDEEEMEEEEFDESAEWMIGEPFPSAMSSSSSELTDGEHFVLPIGPDFGDPSPTSSTPAEPRRGRRTSDGPGSPDDQAGPPTPKTPYLGEALLTQRPPSVTRHGARVVVIIIPVFEQDYRLIGG